MKTIEVVAAIIISPQNKVLIAQRGSNKKFAGKWEFAGGKIENGESHQEALHRELHEEFGLSFTIGKFFKTIYHKYPDFNLILHSYFVDFLEQELKLTEHQSIQWVSPNEIEEFDFVEADLCIVEELMNKY